MGCQFFMHTSLPSWCVKMVKFIEIANLFLNTLPFDKDIINGSPDTECFFFIKSDTLIHSFNLWYCWRIVMIWKLQFFLQVTNFRFLEENC